MIELRDRSRNTDDRRKLPRRILITVLEGKSRLTWVNSERHACIVEVLLQLLNGQAEDRLELLAGEVADALAGLHVLDEAGADAAEIDGSQIVLPLETGVSQHLPQQLMIALLAVLEELFLLSQRIRQLLSRLSFHLGLARLGNPHQVFAKGDALEEKLVQRRTTLELARGTGRR